jgi:nicotinamide-nucleotide amidase
MTDDELASQQRTGPATRIAELVGNAGRWVATAESVSGGYVAAELAAAPSSSDWLRGGVVAYAASVKHNVLHVPPGPVVNAAAAKQMAAGTAQLLDADFAVATTGVGGPGAEEGEPAGTVFVAVAGPSRTTVRQYRFEGEPPDVVQKAVTPALQDLAAAVEAELSAVTTAAAPDGRASRGTASKEAQ